MLLEGPIHNVVEKVDRGTYCPWSFVRLKRPLRRGEIHHVLIS